MASTELNIVMRGNIPGGIKKEVKRTLEDCYQKFSTKAPQKVEVHLIDKQTTVQDFLREEKMKHGITTTGEEEFICCHDAWGGLPRLTICVERLAKLKKMARLGAIRHEAAHSALHGSLEYYIFEISEDCHHLVRIKGIDLTTLQQALYYLSVAVKDFEATRFLIKHDYVNCQMAFALEILQPSEEDKLAWKLAGANRQARFLCQMALLKPIFLAHPLLSLEKSKKVPLKQQIELGRCVEVMVEHLGEAEQRRLLHLVNTVTENLTEDTHNNVDFALRQALNLA